MEEGKDGRARVSRYRSRLERKGMRTNTFVFPAEDNERLKRLVAVLRDAGDDERQRLRDLLDGWAGS